MKRLIATVMAVVGISGAAYAQQPASPRPVVVTVVPASGTFFTQGKDTKAPSFGSYGLGGAVDVRVNRYVGVEGEVTGTLGVTQDLDLVSGTAHLKSPDLLG